MYIPAFNRVEDPEKIHAFIHAYGFATVVTDSAGRPFASHLPVLLDHVRGDKGTLRSHMARANEQWKHFQPDNEEVLCIFHGPHAYISPSWYVQQHDVPTWNYAAVHVYGIPAMVDDAALKQIVLETTEKYEGHRPQPWKLPLSEEEINAMLKAIVGFEIVITRIEAKFKLGQNRSLEDRAGTVRGLAASGHLPSVELAEFMKAQSLT